MAPLGSPGSQPNERHKRVQAVEKTLEELGGPASPLTIPASYDQVDVELHRLAALVYVRRVFPDTVQHDAETGRAVDHAFAMLKDLDTYSRPLPLLVFACEARGDEERSVVLHLIQMTEAQFRVSNFGSLKEMIRLVWTQDDLAPHAISYADKLSRLMSLMDKVPSFI